MKYRQGGYVVLFSVGLFFYGFVAVFAQNNGLVPTGRGNDYNPDGYGLCELVDLVNNLILFLTGLLALLAVLVLIYAGFLMVTSRGGTTAINKAKGLFANLLIGSAIMFAAFLIVNTVLSILLSSVSGALGWETVSCTYENKVGDAEYRIQLTEETYKSWVPEVVGDMPTAPEAGGASGSCESSGLVVGDACYAPNRCLVNVSSGACTAISTYDNYITAAASRYGVSAEVLRGIMITESGGNPNAQSPVGAVGLMQLMPSTAASACGVSGSALWDPATNIDCGARYFASMMKQFGDRNLAIAAYNAGPGGNSASNSCPGLRKWQCPYDSGGCCINGQVTGTTCQINTGYRETRLYVDKVNSAAPRCR